MTPRLFVTLFWKALQSWFSDNASRHGAAIAYYTLFALAPVLLVVIATIGLVFATSGAFLELQAAFNRIWRVTTDDAPGSNLDAVITRRLRSPGIVVSIGFLLMVSLAISAGVAPPFGAAGTIAIILVWVYDSKQIVLLGAEFTYHYSKRRRGSPTPMSGAVRDPLPAA